MKIFNKNSQQSRLNEEKNSTSTKSSKKIFKRTYFVVFSIAIVVTLAVSGGAYWILNVVNNQVEKPEKTTGRFVEFIKASDIKAAYDITDTSFKEVVKENDFADYIVKPNVDRFKNNPVVVDEKIEGKKDNKDYMSIVYRVDEKDDKKFYFSLKLQKVENKWKIQQIYWANKKLTPVPI